jgi:hypothetical protein
MAVDDQAEKGEGNNSDVEGREVNLHCNALVLVNHRLKEQVCLLANDLNFNELG